MIKKRFPNIKEDTLYTDRKLGGYGLMDLEEQPKGRRARILYVVLVASKITPHIILLRDRIQQFIFKCRPITTNSNPHNLIPVITWYEILLRKNFKIFINHQYDHHDDITYFTEGEKSQLKAWKHLISYTQPQEPEQFKLYNLADRKAIIQKPLTIDIFQEINLKEKIQKVTHLLNNPSVNEVKRNIIKTTIYYNHNHLATVV